MMIRHWRYRRAHKPGSFTLQRYKGLGRDGCGATLGDDSESGTK